MILPNKVNKNSNDSEQTSDNHVISDQLLAKALSGLENENIYERPRGKSYRRTKEDNSNNSSPLLNIALFPSPSSPYNISSCNDQDSTVNIEIMKFINKKKDFIVDLVSDASYSSEYHLRSERIMALKKCTSLTIFQNSARKDYEIICKKMNPFIGTSFHPCAPYIEHIHFLLLEHHPIHVLLTLSIYTFFYWNIIPSMCSLH